jgi:hypothetical protein
LEELFQASVEAGLASNLQTIRRTSVEATALRRLRRS